MRVRAVLSSLGCLAASLIVSAQQNPNDLHSMNLLSPAIGWVASENRIWWTPDGGHKWTNITPEILPPGEKISSVFFLDTYNGWVLLARTDYATGATSFDLALTTNSGVDWSIQHLDVPDPDPSRGFSKTGWINFVDRLHGWVMIRMNGNSAVSIGVLLRTIDGGKTWIKAATGPPTAGPVRFTTATVGWVVGDADGELYVTRDGGERWNTVTLATPAGFAVGSQSVPSYALPQFEDPKDGFLMVAYSDGFRFSLAVFSTNDGGQNWTALRLLPTVREAAIGMANAWWVAVSVSADSKVVTLRRLSLSAPRSQTVDTSSAVSSLTQLHSSGGTGIADELALYDEKHAWVLAGALLATNDGGMTWSDITPAQSRPHRQPAHHCDQNSIQGGDCRMAKNTPQLRSSASPSAPLTVGISSHLAFDTSRVLCTKPLNMCGTLNSISYMQTWWNSSPYFDTSLYLPNSPNRGKDPNLNVQWVSAIAQQGWGVFPIWFGLQAPCACGPGSDKNHCVPFKYTFDADDTAKAEQQGVTEADNADTQARALGLGGTVIYHDIENYSAPPGSKCSAVVRAFVSGWVAEMHNKGYASAGVYGNPLPAMNDFSQALPRPDDVWIAKYDNRVTVWGLGQLSDSQWNRSQRMHQYTDTHGETWGNSPQFGIDSDIDNAAIIVGNGVKAYDYPPSSFSAPIDYPGAGRPGTGAVGINKAAEVVGFWYLQPGSGQTSHGFVFDTYSWMFTDDIVFNGAGSSGRTGASGISNAGLLIGDWFNDTKQTAGTFTYDLKTKKYGISMKGNIATGINDDLQVVGLNDTYSAAFLYSRPGGFQNLPLETFDQIGLNGDAQVVGLDLFYDPVLYNPFDGSTTILNCPHCAGARPVAINSNGVIVGIDGTHGFVYFADGASGLFDYPGALQTYFYGINDYGQIVGTFVDSVNADLHGFVATPQ